MEIHFQNGKIDGFGKYSWQDGTTYDGLFDNNILKGFATYKWNNGCQYKGYVYQSKRHGFGTLIIDDPSDENFQKYQGMWRMGKKHGV